MRHVYRIRDVADGKFLWRTHVEHEQVCPHLQPLQQLLLRDRCRNLLAFGTYSQHSSEDE